jgi:hypothetical protein
MEVEEARHNQALWVAYGDAELQEMEGRTLASIGPQEMSQWLRWMIRALSPSERAQLITGHTGRGPGDGAGHSPVTAGRHGLGQALHGAGPFARAGPRRGLRLLQPPARFETMSTSRWAVVLGAAG